MTATILTYLKFGNRFYGVEHTQKHGKDLYYGLVLKKKKKQLDIENSFETETMDTLKTHIPKDKAISLVINTNAVLTKRIQSKTGDSQKLVYMAFPNIKVEDFYYETLSQGEYQFVSICRKHYVDDLLNIYLSKGFMVVDFVLGNLICSTLNPFIDSDTIRSSNASFVFESHHIVDISVDANDMETQYSINGLNIKNTLLLSFAAALQFLTKLKHIQSSFAGRKGELNSSFQQKLFAKQFLKIGLSTLFLILLINFLMFNHYYNEVNSLRETAQVLKASKVKMTDLNNKVKTSEKMVNDILQSKSSKSSFYANVIINRLPESILLGEFDYQPLVKKIKEDKPIENQKNTILISGQTKARVLFSQWISQLETISWIHAIDIVSFEDITSRSSKFTIKLHITNDTKD
ncbi:hypothetical protein [Winogradskyella sp.]|uniref:hypothetical protein n=1 Tax=Winogradskyella sp. TaxID=1883156 RepID=UPI003BAC0AD6